MLLPPPPRNAAPPPAPDSAVRAALVGGAVGAGIGLAFIVAASQLPRGFIDATLTELPSGWVQLPAGIVSLFVIVLVHELGHLIGGRIQQFRFQMLVVGPLAVERDATTDRVSLKFNRNLELAGGVAGCFPVGEHDLVRRMIWMVLGGPIASVVFCGMSIAAAFVLPQGWWTSPLTLLGAVSLLLGAATLIPMRNGSFVTDGKRYLQLRRGGAEARRDAAQLTLMVQDRAGLPVESQSPTLLAQTLDPADGSMQEMFGRLQAYLWLVTQDRPAEAIVQLSRAVDLSRGRPFHVEVALIYEHAFAVAFFENNAELARDLLMPFKAREQFVTESERLRTTAAVALAANDRTLATEQIQKSQALIESSAARASGASQWSLARLRELQQHL